MTAEQLERCQWPPLAPPYADALREAVEFAMNTVDAVGIIATGTIVRGSPHASSDLDVVVIHNATFRQRIQRRFRGVPTEIFINPPAAIRRYFVHEHNDARPITAHMIATGVVVFESDVIVDELRREAAEWLGKPSSTTEDQLVRARYEAATLLEDGVDVGAADPDTATMLITRAVIAMLELDCRVNDGRIPRSKELLGIIAGRNSELGHLAHAFFSVTTYAERQNAAEAIADRTIGARGFFAWDSGPDPVA
jgi:predicted nucleotidyltransferase